METKYLPKYLKKNFKAAAKVMKKRGRQGWWSSSSCKSTCLQA
jgi:hypothetical protein